MIKSTIFVGVALLAILARGQEKPAAPSLLVMGTSETRVAPDNATVRLGIVARATNASEAQAQANNVMQRILTALAGLRIGKQDIQTSNLMLNPFYDNVPRDLPKIAGYEARNTVSVTTTDLTIIGKVVDAGVSSGANNVEGIIFGLRDDTKPKLKALSDAVASAKAKAVAMAEAAGLDLVSIIEINEAGAYVAPPPRMDAGVMMRAPESTPVEPGQMTVNAAVSIRYLIRSKK